VIEGGAEIIFWIFEMSLAGNANGALPACEILSKTGLGKWAGR
jgi:hypothetical protein